MSWSKFEVVMLQRWKVVMLTRKVGSLVDIGAESWKVSKRLLRSAEKKDVSVGVCNFKTKQFVGVHH
jgi:hypothetical protein